MATDDIIVNGHRYRQADRDTIEPVHYRTDQPPVVGYDVHVDPESGRDVIVVSVKVQVNDPANKDKAVKAAENIAAAILVILNACLGQLPGTPIAFSNGAMRTVGDILSTVNSTVFIVTDKDYSANKGVGGANYDNHTVEVNYASYVGAGTYADANYRGQGLIGIVLHDLVHMNSVGHNNRADELQGIKDENRINHSNINYLDSPYWIDNEVFANKGAAQIASAIGIDIGLFNAAAPNQPGIMSDDYYGPADLLALRTEG